MPLTDVGRDFLTRAWVGLVDADDFTVTGPFNEANAHIGFGNGSDPFATWQDGLQGASQFRQPMDPGYPVIDTLNKNEVTFRATFGPDDAMFAWNEWGVFNAESGGVMFTRSVESIGIKPANQTWTFETTITIRNPQ